jgi:hypothetical protein
MGWVAGVVEKWNPHAKIRHDLWGWCDIVALCPKGEQCLIFIQVTSGSNHAARVAKIREWPHLSHLCICADVEVWSYSKRVTKNKDGTKSKRKLWTLRRERVT